MQAGNVDSLWPPERAVMSPERYAELAQRIQPAFLAQMQEAKIPQQRAESLCRLYLPLAAWVHDQKRPGQTFVLGVNGAQGSGKSTLCEFLQLILQVGYGYKVAGFSIDDIYKTHAERQQLGREVHPLLATRGVPGTHDVELGLNILRALLPPQGGKVSLPAFDKAMDDRCPPSQWPVFEAPADIVIFEGWCVGSKPQAEAELADPINELERNEDTEGAWRRYVNRQLAGPYAELYGQFDRLIMLKVPNMESVFEWRSLQERKLAERTVANGANHRIMDAAALKRFIMHYERLTRHNLEEMPLRADLTLFLDEDHHFTRILINR
ncbi:MAG: hypothetical protein PHE55_16835 [Methylococcaceae bacterium]|nr:hypothetical protein [Methylococcaceae bacterium]